MEADFDGIAEHLSKRKFGTIFHCHARTGIPYANGRICGEKVYPRRRREIQEQSEVR